MTPAPEKSDAWSALERELELWQQDQTTATLWWRDDDAQFPVAQLDRLIDLSGSTGTPLVLATIPEKVTPALKGKIGPEITVVQHGWCHQNHAPPEEKKSEFGDHRPISDIQRDLDKGANILTELFGDRFLPILVPPWNRISNTVAGTLENLGYAGLSTFDTLKTEQVVPGLIQANAHVDLINWRGDRGFIGTESAVQQITSHLQQRRGGNIPRQEVTGILTHHLVHDQDLWQFLEELFALTSRTPAIQWQSGQEVFDVQ